MREIGIGIVGGGYMGKAHAVAMSAVGAVFNTNLRPRLEMVCGASPVTSKKYCDAFKGLPYIFNLGHGLLPTTDPDKVEKLIKFYREY